MAKLKRNTRPEIGQDCPRCGSDQTTHPPKNFSRPLDTERGWCMKCGALWTLQKGKLANSV
jgi:hypothetical protein